MKPEKTNSNLDTSNYFHRLVVYTKRDNNVVLVDLHDATASPPMDPWLGRVYVLADGQHTIKELIDLTLKHSPENTLENITETISSVINRLLEAKVIGLSDEPLRLPYYLISPADDQDSKLATKLMLEDGYMHPKN